MVENEIKIKFESAGAVQKLLNNAKIELQMKDRVIANQAKKLKEYERQNK